MALCSERPSSLCLCCFCHQLANLVTGPLPQQRRWVSVRASQAIPECEVLSVIVVEVQVMINMVSGTVNQKYQRAWKAVVSIMDGNGPDVDEDKEGEVNHL